MRLSLQQQDRQPATTLTVVNRILARGAPIQSLQWQADSRQHLLLTRPSSGSDEALLYPVAEAFAELMTTAKPALIKQCEASDCILWFYDQTKSHRRRWCSMALCGNRMKAAAYRQRAKRG